MVRQKRYHLEVITLMFFILLLIGNSLWRVYALIIKSRTSKHKFTIIGCNVKFYVKINIHYRVIAAIINISESTMLVMQLCFCFLILLYLLWFHFHIFDRPIGIDPVQILAPPVRNRTIPVLQSLEKGNRASSFCSYYIPDPIGSGDGCSSIWTIESGLIESGTAEAIGDYQHNKQIYD